MCGPWALGEYAQCVALAVNEVTGEVPSDQDAHWRVGNPAAELGVPMFTENPSIC